MLDTQNASAHMSGAQIRDIVRVFTSPSLNISLVSTFL